MIKKFWELATVSVVVPVVLLVSGFGAGIHDVSWYLSLIAGVLMVLGLSYGLFCSKYRAAYLGNEHELLQLSFIFNADVAMLVLGSPMLGIYDAYILNGTALLFASFYWLIVLTLCFGYERVFTLSFVFGVVLCLGVWMLFCYPPFVNGVCDINSGYIGYVLVISYFFSWLVTVAGAASFIIWIVKS